MSRSTMYELKEMMCKELEEITAKGTLSAGDLETAHKLTDTIKNILKIDMLEEETGYSEGNGDWRASGTYDSRRGYSRHDGPMYSREPYDEHGSSYAGRHWVRGHYSRAEGKEDMIRRIEEMMDEDVTPQEKQALKKAWEALRMVK